MTEVFDFTSLNFLLFDEESGICSRLGEVTIESETLTKDFDLLDKILLSKNFEKQANFDQIAQKFIKWGSVSVVKMIKGNVLINHAIKLLFYIEHLLDKVPLNCFSVALIDKATIMSLFELFKSNFKKKPREYLDLFDKLWILCSKALRDNEVMAQSLNCIYELLKYPESINYIEGLFNYAEKLLLKYRALIGAKIVDKSVIENLLNIVKVVVRSEKHAIVRLHFWWKFICSLNAELVCDALFKPCFIPFLSNLFGKYLTMNSDEKFPYSLYAYNCFTCYSELGPLCNHVMNELLSLFDLSGQVILAQRGTRFESGQHLRQFVDLIISNQSTLDALLISFYYWCQTASLNTAKSAPTPFQLLIQVFKVLAERFKVACKIKQQSLNSTESDDATSVPYFYQVINKMITLKRNLENDLLSHERPNRLIFSDNLGLMQEIIIALEELGDYTSIIKSGLQLLLRVFCEHLSDMNKLIGSDGRATSQIRISVWLDSSKTIIDLTFPQNSMAFNLMMTQDIAMINRHWFMGWMDKDILEVGLNSKCLIANLECWYYLSSKLSRRLDKDSFTTYSTPDTSYQLSAFTEYLAAPVFLIAAIKDGVMTSVDYNEVWKIWQHLYTDLVTKSQLIPDFDNDFAWCDSIISSLVRLIIGLRKHDIFMTSWSLAFNMICRCLRLVALQADTSTSDKIFDGDRSGSKLQPHQPLRVLLGNLCDQWPLFNSDNVKIRYQEQLPDVGDASTVFTEFAVTSSGSKWAKMRMLVKSQFQCDFESNFDTFLSLVKVLMSKLMYDTVSALDVLAIICPKLPLLLDLLICRSKLQPDNQTRATRSRISYDEHVTQLENFLVYLLNRLEITCFKDDLTSDIVAGISPLLVFIFSCETGILSRSTVQSAVNFWNDTFGCDESLEDTVHYPAELITVIGQLKMTNKNVDVPPSLTKQLKAFSPATSSRRSVARQDSGSSASTSTNFREKAKSTPPVGSLLNKVNTPVKDSAKGKDDSISKSLLNKVNTPVKDDTITKSKKTPPNDKSTVPVANGKSTPTKKTNKTPVKEFSSPAVTRETLKRSSRKRSCYDLLRKMSDTDYVVIAPAIEESNNKRIRLTDHQKDSFMRKENEYKPALIHNPGMVLPKMSLISQDSIASTDSLLATPMDTTDIDAHVTEEQQESAQSQDTAKADVAAVEEEEADANKENKDGKLDVDQLPAKMVTEVDSDEQKPLQELRVSTDATEPEETSPVTDDKDILSPTVLIKMSDVLMCSPSSVVAAFADDCDPPAVVETAGTVASTVVIAASAATVNGGGPSRPLTTAVRGGKTMTPLRRTTNNINSLTCSPITSATSRRTQRLVQLAIDNQLVKKEKLERDQSPRPATVAIGGTPGRNQQQPGGIIRHFWSQSKKDARVSFSIPLDDAASGIDTAPASPCTGGADNASNTGTGDSAPLTAAIDIANANNNVSSFLSPIPERIPVSALIIPQQLCVDLNNSLTNQISTEEDQPDQPVQGSPVAQLTVMGPNNLSLQEIVDGMSPICPPPGPSAFDKELATVQRMVIEQADPEKKRALLKALLTIVMGQL